MPDSTVTEIPATISESYGNSVVFSKKTKELSFQIYKIVEFIDIIKINQLFYLLSKFAGQRYLLS
jgi:hypothetical protein